MNGPEDQKCIYIFGTNLIWCEKNFITGNKFYMMILSFISYTFSFILFLVIIFQTKESSSFIFTKIFIFILYFLQIYSTFRAGCTDPGILPKQYLIYSLNKKPERRCIINGHLINLKYCISCDIFIPPRCHHCSRCDNCVEKFDHHCIWLGTCIGLRNYKFFYLLIFCLVINDIYQILFCLYFLLNNIKNLKNDKNTTLKIIISMSIIILYDILFIIFFLGKLFILHTYFCFNNLTFYEYFKEKFKTVPGFNPYNKKFFNNFTQIFCKKSRKTRLFDNLNIQLDIEIKKEIDINFVNNINNNDNGDVNKENLTISTNENRHFKNNSEDEISSH